MRRRGDVMWRNFGWTAVLATWTIFLILNSGLAGERVTNNPQNNNEHTPKINNRAIYFAFDKKIIGDSRLRYMRENFKSNDRSSMHVKAVSLGFKNTENRDSRLNGYEKYIAMSNTMATTKYLKDSDDKSARLITKRLATENMWLSKVIVMEKSKNTRNYLKFISSLRPLLPTSQELKSALRKSRRKERTIYVFSSDRKKARMIRHDTQAFDKKGERSKKHKRDRIFNGENGMTAFFPDKFTKSSRSEKDNSIQKFKNSDISQFETTKGIRFANEIHERNRNERDSRQSLELTKNNTNELIYVEANDKSQRVELTFSNYSSSKENRNGNAKAITTITDNTITKNSPYESSVTVAWTTLIFNSKISSANGKVGDEENTVSPYHSSEDEYSKSYKADKFLADGTYKRNEYSKGFKVSTDTHRNKKRNGDIIDSFTFRAPNLLDNHFTIKRVSFVKRSFPYKKKNALKRSDIFDSRHHSLISDIDAKINGKANLGEMNVREKEEKKITVVANYNKLEVERDLLSTKLSAKEIDESNLDYQMPARISVTQKRNPMHVRHVGSDVNCERPRTTKFEAEVRDAFRIGLWNVSGSSRIAKLGSLLDQKGRPKYSRKFDAINIGTRPPRVAEKTTDGKSELNEEPRRTSTESVSIFFGAANVSDNSTGMPKINERVRTSHESSSELTDEPGLENVRVTTRRGGNHRDMHEGSGFYSRSDDVHNSKYRRYKRHEDRNTPGISTSTEFDSKTWKTLDTARATSNSLIKFTTNPSILTTQTNSIDQLSIDAKKIHTSVETLPSSKYKEFQKKQSIPLMIDHDERYINASARMGPDASNSLEISLIDASKTLNASLVETPFVIEELDRSKVITKIDTSIIPKEISSTAEENVRISDDANTNVSDVSSTELINSQKRHGANGNETVWAIDLFSQRNSDQDVFENITIENVVDASAGDVPSDQWPVKHNAVVEGDLVLGGLMMVHEREDTITCGRVMPQGGIQALEAMLYTLDALNDREIVPGVKIGAHILDDCDKDTYGLEMAVDFIKGTYASERHDDLLYACCT